MANRYYKHQTVKSPQDASVFSDEYTWAVLDVLRIAGPSGISADNVHKKIEEQMGRVSKSKVYAILKRLYQNEWIHRTYNEDDEARRNSIKMNWAGILLEDEYDRLLVDKEKPFISKKIFPVFEEYIRSVISDLQNDPKAKKWLPEKGYCKPCRKSHEAEEFISSLLDIASAEFVGSKECMKLLGEFGLAAKNDTEKER
jgi:hypothetical protein